MACDYRGQAQINLWGNGPSLNGSKVIKGDEWRWVLQISDYELTGAVVQFTAKCDIETPDENAEVVADSKTTSATLGRIVLTSSSHVNLIYAEIIIPTEVTSAIIFPFDKSELMLYFDVRIQRATTATSARKVQTYFRMSDAKFIVGRPVTNIVPTLPIT